METFKEIFESHYTWIEGFMRNVRRYSYRTAIIMPEKNLWTYAELNREVNRLANALPQDGARKGDIVMLQLLNCPEFVFSYVATQKLHAVTSPVSYRLSSGELAKNLKETNPKVLMFEERHRTEIKFRLRDLQRHEQDQTGRCRPGPYPSHGCQPGRAGPGARAGL